MNLATRIILILMLTFALASQAIAQETTAADPATTETATAASSATTPREEPAGTTQSRRTEREERQAEDGEERDTFSSADVRNKFVNLLSQHPSELPTMLTLDPTLLSNEAFLAGYPDLAEFVKTYPQVRRNPRYYLANYYPEPTVIRNQSPGDEILEGTFILSIMGLIAFTLAWIVRTIIEQRRWSRLSRIQTEVHNKILDRFGTSTELIEYMKTPAGSRFLESAPIPLRETPVTPTTPASRVLWSIQVGIVVGAGALGMMIVSGRLNSSSLFGLGVILFCFGAGFVASALVSLTVSRRLGLWQGPSRAELEDTGTVR
jgi:hypothetical protein